MTPALVRFDDVADDTSEQRKVSVLVDQLCAATTKEQRSTIAGHIRVCVENVPWRLESFVFSPANTDFAEERGHVLDVLTTRLQRLLTSDSSSYRLGAIAAITELVANTKESTHARAQRTANAVRCLFTTSNTDMPTATAASELVSALADINSPLSSRAIDHVLNNAINLINARPFGARETSESGRSTDRARAAMVITVLAGVDKGPKFVLNNYEQLTISLWDVICDFDPEVRLQGVRGLQAILETVVVRAETHKSKKAMWEVVTFINRTLAPKAGAKAFGPTLDDAPTFPATPRECAEVHGSLMMLSSLLKSSETTPYMHAFSSELCRLSLRYQPSHDISVRTAVAGLLPLLVRLDRNMFADDFLEEVHSSTMDLINDKRFPAAERGRSLVSLASIEEQVSSNSDCSRVEDMLHVCRETLLQPPADGQISYDAVLETICHLARSWSGRTVFERYIRGGMLMRMFNTDFTSLLVSTINEVRLAVPSIEDFICSSLVNLIAATLKKGLPDKGTGLPVNVKSRNSPESDRHRGGMSRRPSTTSLNRDRLREGFRSSDILFSQTGTTGSTQAGPSDFFDATAFSFELQHVDSSTSLQSRSSSSSGSSNSLGTGDPLGSPQASTEVSHSKTTAAAIEAEKRDRTNSPCVALKAIVLYDFTNLTSEDLSSFASEYVMGYVESNNVKVRALAVDAAGKLMDSAARVWFDSRKSSASSRILRPDIQAILAQLVLISVADPCTKVRLAAIHALDRKVFHPYLLQPEILNTLFMCFHDLNLSLRDSALSLVGRLGHLNPAYILPALRSYLGYILSILRFDGQAFSQNRKEATELLQTLVENADYFILPYTQVVVEALLLRLEELKKAQELDLAIPALNALSKMGGVVSPIDLKPFKDPIGFMLVSYVLDAQNSDTELRKSLLNALSAVVQNTAWVIKPYTNHPNLLPRLLDLLKTSDDNQARPEVVELLGVLGAVDPDDHKYAAIPMFATNGRLSSFSRGTMSDIHSKSFLKSGSNLTNGSPLWGVASSQPPSVGLGGRPFLQNGQYVNYSEVIIDSSDPVSNPDGYYPDKDGQFDFFSPLQMQRGEQAPPPVACFSLGGARLEKLLKAYCPDWAREELEPFSLVGQLDHPFSASPDYFPSLLLDELHKIIEHKKTRRYIFEACHAIVNVVRSVGSRCSYFLPEVVPRMQMLIHRILGEDNTKNPVSGTLKLSIIICLGEIVQVAGHSFMPHVTDTVLLAWFHLKRRDIGPACAIGFCDLLMQLRTAIGDEFKPVIVTVLPPLLAMLGDHENSNPHLVSIILRTLESFCPQFDDFGGTVLSTIMKVVFSERTAVTVRTEALASLARIIYLMEAVQVHSDVIHPLVQILAGSFQGSYPKFSKQNGMPHTQDIPTLPVGAADQKEMGMYATAALIEIGVRSPRGFNVFIPVIAKALKHGYLGDWSEHLYNSFRRFLSRRSPRVVRDILGDTEDNGADIPQLSDSDVNDQIRRMARVIVPNQRTGSAVSTDHLPEVGPSFCTTGPYIMERYLLRKWDVESYFEGAIWEKWLTDIGTAMFKQSGSRAFRACIRISESFPSLTKQLFNAAFLSCWTCPLSDHAKSRICASLDAAISSLSTPLIVVQAVLNLFEFMDHDEKPLPCENDKLSSTALRCGALAKAIRYKEQDYSAHIGKKERLYESIHGENGIITIYEKLGHVESAVGIIEHYQKETGHQVQDEWYEKLQRWEEALDVYERKDRGIGALAGTDPFAHRENWETVLGRLRCLNHLGEWHKMITLLQETRQQCNGNDQAIRELALEGKGLSVTFDLSRWDQFESWVRYISADTYDGCFYHALLRVRKGKDDPTQLDDAKYYVSEARARLERELTARISEGYPRAYSHIVRAEALVELDEMISFLRLPTVEARQRCFPRLQEVWNKRLQGCKRDRKTWYRLLMTRSLILEPLDNKGQWLELATMCRKAKLLPMATEVLQKLLVSYEKSLYNSPGSHEDSPSSIIERQRFDAKDIASVNLVADLQIRFACIKQIWVLNRRVEAYQALEKCRLDYLSEAGLSVVDPDLLASHMGARGSEEKRCLAGEVFSKLSKWGLRLRESGEVEEDSVVDPLSYAELTTRVRPRWYKAWHYWASMNASRFEDMVETKPTSNHRRRQARMVHLGSREKEHLTNAVRGYFEAINLSGKTRLEDSLKVLKFWFRYGGQANMHLEFNKGFEETNIAMWLEVVPQIIARLHTPFIHVQKGVKALLTKIGTEHPHVAVYPLTVAKTTGGSLQEARSRAAHEILEDLKYTHVDIVEQAEKVAHELVRVAVLWTEMWYEKLEEASKTYFVEHDVDGMIDILMPLHEELEAGAATICEQNFIAEFGQDLQEAAHLCRSFQAERSQGADEETLNQMISQAWTLYTHVFKRIQRQQHGMQELDIGQVSYGLREARNLSLAVPGTYDPNEGAAVVSIQAFNPVLSVMQSKQRPRKLSIIGSDGHDYQFLLKGHEDLRQDERVMQVFGLVNKLFSKSDQRALLQGVGMQTYSVIALSANAGLIEWVPDCDTMHALVKEYREARKIAPNAEQRVMLQVAPEPERLTLLQKVDLFQFMLDGTGGCDIARVLWLKSRNSEMWLERRTTYAKSLATTSMTGYILGLGDRHPSNLMIDRTTGKVMHIDFGDCFEVAMKREKYPEKVPFRLTRMLVNALEPCGVEGYFRHTSIAALEVLRQKNANEALMSMLEAFVYDPLIRWKLINAEELTQLREEGEAARGVYERERRPGGLQATSLSHATGSVPREVSEIVSSLAQTGSLSASMRRFNEAERRREEAGRNEPQTPGAIATPRSSTVMEDMDLGDLVTPNYQARVQQARLARDPRQPHDFIADVANQRAQDALDRCSKKLNGKDYDDKVYLPVRDQVERLIRDARNIENLCTLFLGWCAFW